MAFGRGKGESVGAPGGEQPHGRRELLVSKTWLQVAGLVVLVGFCVLVLLAYLALWPVPADPVAWRAPAFTGYAGPHAANQRLSAAQIVSVAPGIGPEHIDVGPDGKLYTAVLSGDVLRMTPDGSAQEVLA